MKLAEALLEKKNVVARIAELQGRYSAAAVIEEGTEPDESAEEILTSLSAALLNWENLTVSINLTNNVVKVGDGTMMKALAHRDSLKTQIAHYSAIANSIRQRNRRGYGETATKMVIAEGVSTKYFIKLVDDLSKELRMLDAEIQAANWVNELTA